MTHHRIRTSKLALGLLAALAAAPAMAQTTSAGVGGQVVGSGGAPVAGAEVTITHVESGTVSHATTDAAGRYTARGLRVGGPYTITITKPGEGTKTEDGVYLDLNKINTVDAALTGDVTNLGSVQAIGYSGGSDVFSATKMGSGTSVNQQTIQALPSINGNIRTTCAWIRAWPSSTAPRARSRPAARIRATTRSTSTASRPATPSAWKATT